MIWSACPFCLSIQQQHPETYVLQHRHLPGVTQCLLFYTREEARLYVASRRKERIK